MKITNNEIVVDLPNLYFGQNKTVAIIKGMNPPCVVDVEALAKILTEYREEKEIEKPQEWSYRWAQHLAANLDKWLIEKKEPV